MATANEVQKLAALARIQVDEAELEKFTKEFDAILTYVGQLETLRTPQGEGGTKPALRNVMREDGTPHTAGLYTEKLTEQFPEREGTALKVKQIISHD